MSLRYTGTFDELKAALSPLEGKWVELNPNQQQFRHSAGAILNWYPSTGAINFQGKPPAASALEKLVADSLSQAAVGKTAGRQPVATLPAEPPPTLPQPATMMLGQKFVDSELVIGLVGPVGAELRKVLRIVQERLNVAGYFVTEVSVSTEIIPSVVKVASYPKDDEYARISAMMDAGNGARKAAEDNSILALGAASWISSQRAGADEGRPEHKPRQAYIINSLKHPDEVARLREIYPRGFHLIGVHADEKRRHQYLTSDKRIDAQKAVQLMDRDQDEHLKYGQRVADTFHLSDFFVRIDGDDDQLKKSLWRILDILFGDPFRTPTFDEYAMFLAFAASLRSADLSRQVGAVVAKNREILATGANDCPKAGGGLYWPQYDDTTHSVEDEADGRDYKRGEDSNRMEQKKIVEEILSLVLPHPGLDAERLAKDLREKTRIGDLTEFGRVVHAEMEALLACARNTVSAREGTLYTTTFPCHNCAKHVIAAGIERVVFIEPYQKSKAAEFHSDSIRIGFGDTGLGDPADKQKRIFVRFEPFVGVGPRRFFDLFSLRLGSGLPLKRKDTEGQAVEWKPEDSQIRLQMLPCSYLDLELIAGNMFNKAIQHKEKSNGR